MGSTVPASRVNEYLVKKLYQDLAVESVVATQVIIREDSVVGSDDGTTIMIAPADINVDITVSGKNGLDTGSPADGWYELYMIYNPSTEEVAGLLVAFGLAPIMPSGFTKKRFISTVRRSSGNFLQYQQDGDRVHFEFSQGLFATTSSSGNYFGAAVSSAVPWPRSKEGFMHGYARANSDGGNDTLICFIRGNHHGTPVSSLGSHIAFLIDNVPANALDDRPFGQFNMPVDVGMVSCGLNPFSVTHFISLACAGYVLLL